MAIDKYEWDRILRDDARQLEAAAALLTTDSVYTYDVVVNPNTFTPAVLVERLIPLAQFDRSILNRLETRCIEDGRISEARFVARALLLREVLTTDRPERFQLRHRGV